MIHTLSEATIISIHEDLPDPYAIAPKTLLGHFLCASPHFPAPFIVFPGHLTSFQRAALWLQRDTLVGKTLTFKHFLPSHSKSPRSPTFVSFHSTLTSETLQ